MSAVIARIKEGLSDAFEEAQLLSYLEKEEGLWGDEKVSRERGRKGGCWGRSLRRKSNELWRDLLV